MTRMKTGARPAETRGEEALPCEAPKTSLLGRLAFSRRGSLAAIALLVALVYGRTATFGFSDLDDKEIIIDKMAFLKDLTHLDDVFKQPITPLSDGAIYYRPLVTAGFILAAQFGESAVPFHVMNILMHAAAAGLVLLYLRRLFGATLAFFGAAVFAVHPALATIIAWVPGGIDALLALAVLGALLCYIEYLEQGRRRYLVAHLLCFFAALLIKETAVVVPLFCLGHVFFFAKRYRSQLGGKELWAAWGVAFVAWYLMRAAALPAVVGEPMWTRLGSLLESAPVLLMHLGKIVLPLSLSVIAVVRDTPIMPGVGAAVAILFALYRWPHARSGVVYGLGIFALFLGPTLLASDVLILENRLYLPTLGLIIVVLSVLKATRVRFQPITLGTASLIGVFAVMAFRYSAACENPRTFAQAAAKGSPHSALAHMQLGTVYYRSGDLLAAERAYQRAIELDPYQRVVKNNLAVLYLNTSRLSEAEALLNAEVAANPYYVKSYYNLGLVLKGEGRPDEAARAWQRAAELDPGNVDALGELFAHHLQRGELEQASQYRRRLESLGLRFVNP